MNDLFRAIAVNFIVLFIYTNFSFLESVFEKGKIKVTGHFVKSMYGVLIPATFLILPITTLSLVATISLQIIYVMRLSKKVGDRLKEEAPVRKSLTLNYFLSLYWVYFAKPSLIILLSLLPAVVVIYIFSRFS